MRQKGWLCLLLTIIPLSLEIEVENETEGLVVSVAHNDSTLIGDRSRK